jgi:hypothetical protein
MKKNILLILLALMFPCSLLFANYDDDIWVYALHLEVKQGVLAVDTLEKYPYDLVPMAYDGPTTPGDFDFYGTVINKKGTALGQFAFNKPETEVISLGKSVLNVKAPYFANADHITLYKKGGVKLFTISVSETSFCNDNNKCNSDVGENYRNCPNDCPVPADVTTPTPEETTPTSEITPTPSPTVSPEVPVDVTTVPPSTTDQGTAVPQTNVVRAVAFVTGILAILLGTILWLRRRKKS